MINAPEPQREAEPRPVRDLSAAEYATAEAELLTEIRRGIHAKRQAESLDRIVARYTAKPKADTP